MHRILRLALSFLLTSAAAARAADIPLNTVQFPERRTIDVPFAAMSSAPLGAKLEAEVRAEGPQALIELEYRNLQPAVLFGGQVNSYVLWVITRDGVAQNLGELWGRNESGKARFQTGQKEFAMIVTAESIPGTARPSDVVVFVSQPVKHKLAKNSAFSYSGFRPGIRRDVVSIGGLRYTGRDPLELYQARRIYEMGQLAGLGEYDPRSMEEARTALAQATNTANDRGSARVIGDYSRRAVALVSTASRAMAKAVAEREETERAARRRAEIDALGRKATAAEQSAADADAARRRAEVERDAASRAQADSAAQADRLARERQAAEQNAIASDAARREAEVARRRSEEAQQRSEELRRQAEAERSAAEKAKAEASEQAAALDARRSEAEQRAREEAARQAAALDARRSEAERAREEAARQAAALETQKNQLSADKETLSAEKQTLSAERDRVQKERDALQQRLSSALSGVATTRGTARGIVVSLPGIFFDTGRAVLKPSAQVGLAKMAGVLSVFPDMNLRIEGYTDSTGTAATNERLSRARAAAVAAFLQKEGIAASRIVTEGYGPQFPVASNTTPAGRARNRRVEVVLAEGVVPAPVP